jgi:hypothetical protein
VKWPKAVSKIVEDKEALRTFYEFPASIGATFGPLTL